VGMRGDASQVIQSMPCHDVDDVVAKILKRTKIVFQGVTYDLS